MIERGHKTHIWACPGDSRRKQARGRGREGTIMLSTTWCILGKDRMVHFIWTEAYPKRFKWWGVGQGGWLHCHPGTWWCVGLSCWPGPCLGSWPWCSHHSICWSPRLLITPKEVAPHWLNARVIWSCPSPAESLRRKGPILHLGSTIELTMFGEYWGGPVGVRKGEKESLTCPVCGGMSEGKMPTFLASNALLLAMELTLPFTCSNIRGSRPWSSSCQHSGADPVDRHEACWWTYPRIWAWEI